MAFNSRALHKKQAKKVKSLISEKLIGGKGLTGRQLPRKKKPNGRPLAFGKTRGGIPARVRRAKVRAFNNGFDIFVANKVGDIVFDRGSARQVEREIYGIHNKQAEEFAAELLAIFVKEGERVGLFKKTG